MFRIPVHIENREIGAVIDTAAQVTLISDTLYKSLDRDILVLRKLL